MSLKHRPTGDFDSSTLQGAPSDIGILGVRSPGSVLADKICNFFVGAYRAVFGSRPSR